jgi:hypothetical protein
MALNSDINVGIRRFIYGAINEYRNFEPQGGQLYRCNRQLEYSGVVYADGDTIPFDNPGGDAYSNDALMEVYFNAGLIDPAS